MARDTVDNKYAIESPNKSLVAVGLTLLSIWLISSHWLFVCEFVKRHPGLLSALVGAAGGIVFDWNEATDKHGPRKKFFLMLLFLGLAYELLETAQADKEAGNAIKLAGDANERAANTESNNLVLRSKVVALEAEVQWRTIKAEQSAVLTNRLVQLVMLHSFISHKSINIVMWTQDGDFEARTYGASILDLLKGCGISGGFFVNGITSLEHALLPPGLSIGVCDPNKVPTDDISVNNIFNEAGMNSQLASWKDVPGFSDDNVNIIVGQKPPPK